MRLRLSEPWSEEGLRRSSIWARSAPWILVGPSTWTLIVPIHARKRKVQGFLGSETIFLATVPGGA